ncbi:ribonuclease III [Desulfovibrio sp.]
MDEVFEQLQERIHHRFGQVKLLREAVTHSSYANEQEEPMPDNERLEFLGDAVLELCVSGECFRRYPEADEGRLTKIRAKLVKEKSLARLARDISLDACLRLGRGEETQGGRGRESLLADALEAVFGAVFLDAGFEAARACILGLLEDRWPEEADCSDPKDHKSRLQEVTQRHFRERPRYFLSGASGPEHEKVFEVTLRLPGGLVFSSTGGSLKRAEQSAAQAALQHLAGQGLD